MAEREDQPGQPAGAPAAGGSPPSPPPAATPPSATEPRRTRRWLIVVLVVVGIGAAGVVGYLIGGNSRDDDVDQAETRAANANEAADSANQALEQDQAQDEQALEGIREGFQNLGDAIAREEAKDDQAAQDAVDQATKEIQSGFDELGAKASAQLEQALGDLSNKINAAVGSGSAEGSEGTGGQ